MMRGLIGTVLSACLAGGVGVGLFFVKHEVRDQEARLRELNEEIHRNQEVIHVLKAEWSYLNDPARLRALSEKFLAMKVMQPGQIATLQSLQSGPVYAQAKPATQPSAVVAKAPAAPAAKPAPVIAKAEPAKPAPVVATAKPHSLVVAKSEPVRSAPAAPSGLAMVPKAPPPPAAIPAQPQRPAYGSAPATAQAPSRSIVIQSPALASSPPLPGEVR